MKDQKYQIKGEKKLQMKMNEKEKYKFLDEKVNTRRRDIK